MIRVYRKDGTEFLLNADLIQSVQGGKETIVTLCNGEHVAVKNTVDDVLTKIRAYRYGRDEENREYEARIQEEARQNEMGARPDKNQK